MLKPLELKDLTPEGKRRILRRSLEAIELVKPKVSEILGDVGREGDVALLRYALLFDGVELEPSELRVSEEELKEARQGVSEKTASALEKALKSLRAFHEGQLPRESGFLEVQPGVWLKDAWKPLDSVGVYVPGGRASYPSTALMTVVPARVAGVKRIVACTPPRPGCGEAKVDPAVLFALDLAGVKEVYRLGGVQAMAAMAYGTKTVPRADKIVGPGNVYVTAAKLLLAGFVGIDCLAGPSEILILADEGADPGLVSKDLLSQLEHGPGASAVLVTASRRLAYEVSARLDSVAFKSSESAKGAEERAPGGPLEGLSLLVAEDEEEALTFVNEYAPEHLEVLTRDPMETLKGVKNAGSVFLGPFSPVAAGDYATGANHVLPTAGAARFQSGLSVYDFLRRFTVQRLSQRGLEGLREAVGVLAREEGLPAHAEAVEARFGEKGA